MTHGSAELEDRQPQRGLKFVPLAPGCTLGSFAPLGPPFWVWVTSPPASAPELLLPANHRGAGLAGEMLYNPWAHALSLLPSHVRWKAPVH